MILLLLGLGLIIVGLFVENKWLFAFLLVIGAALVWYGAIIPIHGYEERVFQDEYPILPIAQETHIYLIVDSDESVTCKGLKDREYDEETQKEMLYTYENAEIIVAEEGTTPVLRVYVKQPITSPFSFAASGAKTEYVFVVPESYIWRMENEHVN